jgi:hypothetical protein
MNQPPIAIAITIPSLTKKGSASMRGNQRSLAYLKAGEIEAIRFSIGRQPKHDILHLYIVRSSKVVVRLTIAGYADGEACKCWDGKVRSAFWVVCVDPSEPREPVDYPGFRGFRYIYEPLW